MSTAWNRIARMLGITIPTSIAVMAMASGAAWAQSTIWPIEGSDTLNDVIKQSIILSSARLVYSNPGSGQAEHDMTTDGSQHYLEGIGPMSRNFTKSVLDAHPSWYPTDQNVLCLDAGVVVVNKNNAQTKQFRTYDIPLDSTKTENTAYFNTDMAVILSGCPSGCANGCPQVLPGHAPACTAQSAATTAECSHPDRLTALGRLTSLLGVSRVDHILRRDDKSGTQDTFREHMGTLMWCNGKSEGNTDAPGSNMLNQDLDPIRRPCSAWDTTTRAETRCTYYPLAQTCHFGDSAIGGAGETSYTITDPATGNTLTNPYGEIQCTQGLVVALSEADPGMTDITESLGRRVSLDTSGYTIGLAGLAAVQLADNSTFGPAINSITHAETSIRTGQYMFARRLFLQRATDVQATEDPDRAAQENVLFTWATNRCNMEPLCQTYGFLPPLPLSDCAKACLDNSNITCLQAGYGISTPKQNIGADNTACDAKYPCVKNGQVLSGGSCGVASSTLCPLI